MRIRIALIVAIVTALSFGCNESPQTEVATSGQQAGQQPPGFAPVRPAKTYTDPQHSVHDFLIAVTTGDDATATALLTTKAQEEAWSNGLAISSDGFPNARFKMTETLILPSGLDAEVGTVWMDGNNETYPCVWMLKKEQHGWCISGMATKFLENAPAVELHFEDQKEMAQRQQEAMRMIQEHQQRQMASSPQQQASRFENAQADGQSNNGQSANRQVRQASGTQTFR